jgi:hypothetical protein
MPEARTEENGVVRPPSLPITNSPMLDQGLLSVRFKGEGSGRGADGTIVLTYDVFDAETMAYVHSVRLRVPQRGTKSYAYYAARRGLLTTVQDTTVYIYRVEDGGDGV